jgi:hypothetical protein
VRWPIIILFVSLLNYRTVFKLDDLKNNFLIELGKLDSHNCELLREADGLCLSLK